MLKGKSKIQLFDAATGKEQACYKDENMVTNAVANLLNPKCRYFFASSNNLDAVYNRITPLAQRALGGIILWQSELPETANTILPPEDCFELAHAGNAYSGTAKNRGTYNENESGPIAGGYRHVWDFSTDRANGSFRAITLTSVKGGNTGWNAKEASGRAVDDIYNFNNFNSAPVFIKTFCPCEYTEANTTCLGRFEENIFLYMGVKNGAATISKISCANPAGINLTTQIGNGTAQNTLIKTAVFADAASSNNFGTTDDGQIILMYKTASKNYKFTIIDPITLEISRQFTLTTEYDYETSSDIMLDGGDLYLKRQSSAYIDKISSSSGHIYNSIQLTGSEPMCISRFAGGFAAMSMSTFNYCCDGETVVPLTVPPNQCIRFLYDCDTSYPYILAANTNNVSYAVVSGYLATINNLDYVVTKTELQTMKITYEIYND